MSSDYSNLNPVLQEASEIKAAPCHYVFSAHELDRHNGRAHCSRGSCPQPRVRLILLNYNCVQQGGSLILVAKITETSLPWRLLVCVWSVHVGRGRALKVLKKVLSNSLGFQYQIWQCVNSSWIFFGGRRRKEENEERGKLNQEEFICGSETSPQNPTPAARL